MNVSQLFSKAQKSSWGLKKLNFILLRMIPFNKPHGLRVKEISDTRVAVKIPYRKKNLNHLKGLHACVLATGAEYCSGLLLLSQLGVKDYRLIMESMDIKYHYQAKSPSTAVFEMSREELKSKIVTPLQTDEAVFYQCEINVHDSDQNLICTVHTNWQIKSWKKVKTSRA